MAFDEAGFAHSAAWGESHVVAGAYRGYWNDLDIGLVQDGYNLRTNEAEIPITADIAGETKLDARWAGVRPSITFTMENWNAQAMERMIWWHGVPVGANNAYEYGTTFSAGRSKWEYAKPLILSACDAIGFNYTPKPATPEDADAATTITPSTAADAGNPNIDPLDIVFFKTLLRADFDVDVLFSHQPRFVTVTLDIFPVGPLNGAGLSFDSSKPDDVVRVTDCGTMRFWNANRGTAA